MTPQEFIAKWGPGGPAYNLNEEQGAQSHFLDLCALLGVSKPGSEANYLFEEKGALIGGKTGYTDVFKRGFFAWENKAPGKNLDAALKQLLAYSLALDNPPLLVVCDRLTIRIHTQFNGHPSETHTILLAELDQPEKQTMLRHVWTNPESFRPRRTSRDITNSAARSFATLADQMRKRGNDAEQVAHFLTQCLFCFFAEDVGLLPGRMFERLVNNRRVTSAVLTKGLQELFTVMRDGGLYGPDDIPWFNGGLFQKIAVPRLEILDVTELRNAAALNWSAIDVSIFGTLFERGLDPAKRAQLGAHYTDPATIERIIDPVIRRPLLQKWDSVAGKVAALMAKSRKRGDKSHREASRAFIEWLDYLKDFRALDPACGSGNFLYLALKALKDIEHRSHLHAADMGLDRQTDLVTGPHNVLGIELNEYAAELARVTVWIGELQWRLTHGYEFKVNPILEPLEHIECRDALLEWQTEQDAASRRAIEATWPHASCVIGNPPFLGDKKMRAELGDEYTQILRVTFNGRVPAGADLCCYWFEKARKAIESDGVGAVGLVATNSIRGGKNRIVLSSIVRTTRIFDAWSDEEWVNEGAAVRVSLVAFGHATQDARLNGIVTGSIYADLTPSGIGSNQVNLTAAERLQENRNASFQGSVKVGEFDLTGQVAREWLTAPNVNGKSNADVLRPLRNAKDITTRPRDAWIVDFERMSVDAAGLYEKPFEHVRTVVKPYRALNRDKSRRENWWLHGRTGDDLRAACKGLPRVIVTPRVAKYRLIVFLHSRVYVDDATVLIARSDDTTFGILHSRFHELWSLRMGTWLGVGNDPRYTPTTCFETFPFPAGLTPANTADQRTEAVDGGWVIPAGLPAKPAPSARDTAVAIARCAKRLNELREAWLYPPEWTQRVPEVVPLGMTKSPYPDRILPKPGHETDLAQRTLTKLYNQRPGWLQGLHKDLDVAVAAAYGWADYTPEMPDDEILRRLLALNVERSK